MSLKKLWTFHESFVADKLVSIWRNLSSDQVRICNEDAGRCRLQLACIFVSESLAAVVQCKHILRVIFLSVLWNIRILNVPRTSVYLPCLSVSLSRLLRVKNFFLYCKLYLHSIPFQCIAVLFILVKGWFLVILLK